MNSPDKKSQPLISVIILNYNADELLITCVESVLTSNYKNLEVIVVDNASKDGSHKKCKQKFPQIHLIENKENLGYCEGNNIGLRNAHGKFVVILNPDTIVDPNWLIELIDAFGKNGDGLYQPKFLTTTNHDVLMSAGNKIQLFGFGFARGKGEIDPKNFEKLEIIDYPAGAGIFTTLDIIEKIGAFDPYLFAYHDDLDLGWRAALQGIKSYYVPKSIIYHPPEGFSFKWNPFKFYLLERNRQYCLLTHYSRRTFFKMLPALLLVEIAVIIFYWRRGLLRLKIKAFVDLIKNREQVRKRYNEIQQTRKLDDREIIKNFSDKISVPKEITGKNNLMFFNNFINVLSRLTRPFI